MKKEKYIYTNRNTCSNSDISSNTSNINTKDIRCNRCIKKKDLFKTSAQSIADSAEKKYITNKLQNNDEKVTCDNIAQLSKEDYSKCTIRFNSEGKATINLIGNRIKPLYNYENKYDIVIITDVGYYGLGIMSVEIPDTATSIGYRAFAKNQLTNVTIIFPTTPLTIDCYAFDNNLEWIIYPSNVTVAS